jgi:hypothetical protein
VRFGDEVVVLDAAGRRAHRLNHTAAVILDLCDGGRTREEVRAAAAARFAVDPEAIAVDVAQALDALADAGLVDGPGAPASTGSDPGVPPTTPGVPPTVPAGSSEPVPAGARSLGPYRAGPLRFSVVAAGRAADEAARVLAPLRDPGPDAAHRYRLTLADVEGGAEGGPEGGPEGERGGRVALSLDGTPLGTFADDGAALAYLEWHLNRQVIEGTRGRVVLHAAGVGLGGAVVALPAGMDAGKSTLATALVRRGLDYVTDEALCIRPADLTVEPYPKAVTLEPGSFAVFPDLAGVAGAVDARFASVRWRVTPDQIRPGAKVAGGRVVAVVSPRYEPGATCTEHHLDPVEAFLVLLEQAFPATFDDDEAVAALVRLAEEVPCVRLVHGGGVDAVDAVVAHLVAAGGEAPPVDGVVR